MNPTGSVYETNEVADIGDDKKTRMMQHKKKKKTISVTCYVLHLLVLQRVTFMYVRLLLVHTAFQPFQSFI